MAANLYPSSPRTRALGAPNGCKPVPLEAARLAPQKAPNLHPNSFRTRAPGTPNGGQEGRRDVRFLAAPVPGIPLPKPVRRPACPPPRALRVFG